MDFVFLNSLERPTLASGAFLFLLGHFHTYESPKLMTFAYNSKTVRSSYMKFWQQFEINELYVCIKFKGKLFRDFCFRTRKPPQKFGAESGLIQKRLNYGQIFHIIIHVLKYPFIPTDPLLAAMKFFLFVFLFFSFFLTLSNLFLVGSSFLKPQNNKI